MRIFGNVLLAVLLSAGTAHAQGFHLNATLLGEKYEGKMVYLCKGRGLADWICIDSARIHGAQVTFHGILQGEELLSLRVFPDESRSQRSTTGVIMRPYLPVMMGNEMVAVKAAVDSLGKDFYTLAGMDFYDYSHVSLSGSNSAQCYADFSTKAFNLRKASNEILQQMMKKLTVSLNTPNGQAPTTQVMPRENKGNGMVMERVEALNAAEPSRQALNEYIRSFVKDNIQNAVGMQVFLGQFDKFTYDEINMLENAIPAHLKATPLGEEIFTTVDAAKVSCVGAPFYDCELQSPEGETFCISDYVGKGKWVLLEFWASWCKPCRADIPHLKQVYEAYHPYGFEIVSISMDSNRNAWINAVKSEEMRWPQGSTLKAFGDNLSKVYYFKAIPFCILITPDGKIAQRNWRGLEMDRGLVNLFGNHFNL